MLKIKSNLSLSIQFYCYRNDLDIKMYNCNILHLAFIFESSLNQYLFPKYSEYVQ